MDKEKVTIEDFAAMVQRGFADTKRDMASGFAAVSQRLDAVEDRLDSIEKLLLGVVRQ